MATQTLNQYCRSVVGEARWNEIKEVLDRSKSGSSPLVSSLDGDAIGDFDVCCHKSGGSDDGRVSGPIGSLDNLVQGGVGKAVEPIKHRKAHLSINQMFELRGFVVPPADHVISPEMKARMQARLRNRIEGKK
ncbi:hypothetical protein PSQ19_06160 [Devosia algicola]|uniref:Uncharacterized protein n=1 Tax=Devosia algicola TaxID=3026418 RepID=A0ABY7YR41_9HYPH|nr:hypothetical protein [Devosia algicola]WDR03652.1 hypothetical protein PSQ19_06160 [Devosia algicola]